MEQQPAHQAQPGDLERKLAEMFPVEGLRDAARSSLRRYGRENWHREVDRVRLAVLKLAGPDLTAIDKHVDAANVDYRDALAMAEYPEYMKLPPDVDPESGEARRAIESDRKQYEDWIGSS